MSEPNSKDGGGAPDDEVARLTEAVRALPEEITRSLRASPLSVREARSKWRRRLALAGAIAAAASGTYALVSNLTQPSVVQQVAPISRTAERLDNGLGRFDAFWAHVKADYRELKARIAPGATPAKGSTRPWPRVIHLGSALSVTLDRGTDPARETRRFLRSWRASP
jgi:hypothetical protein